MFVKEVYPSIIHNSRGERTIQIKIKTYEGIFSASAPSGKSRGKNEVEQYNLQGIEKSLELMRILAKKFEGQNITIKKIDDLKHLIAIIKKFEGQNGYLGGNVTYALETAFLKAAAAENKQELFEFIFDEMGEGMRPKMPMPVGNCIGGGLHSKLVHGKRPDFQEFLLIPNEKTFGRAVTINIHAYNYARKLLHPRGKNDEGAWRTDKSNEEVLEILNKISEKYNVRIGIDIASSTFYNKGYYNYKNKNLIRDKSDESDYIEQLIKKYGLFYVEDPMQEEDFGGFKEILGFSKEYHGKTLVVGDDLTTTNMKQLRRAVNSGSINAMIVKPNQIGSIVEVKDVVEFCKKNNIKIIFSHRSGETMDDSLADYAIGFGADFIKTGISGPERLIKLKRVMDIEKALSL